MKVELKERIITLRKEWGLSQEDLAEKLQLTRQTISKWETGASTPDLEMLLRLSEVFGVSVDMLLGKEPLQKIGVKQSERKKDVFPLFLYIFSLMTFASGVVLFIYSDWMLAVYGGRNKLIAAASMWMIFVPIILFFTIAVCRAIRKRNEKQ